MNYIIKYNNYYTIEFMNQIISKIYPPSKNAVCKANNVYLPSKIKQIKNPLKPLYYANFLTSFDGRIATFSSRYKRLLTPNNIKSDVDFSLFCQLHAQADCLVTNTQYIKGLNKGFYGDILSIKNPKLEKWRNKNKLKKQKIIILSNSLNFPINKKIIPYKENIIILTTSKNQKKINSFKSNGFEVLKFTGKNISVNQLNNFIIKRKFYFIYFIAGPNIVEQFICKNMLDKLYCSISLNMMGTKNYDTIIRGEYLKKPIKLNLLEMYIYQDKKKSNYQTLFQVFNLKGK